MKWVTRERPEVDRTACCWLIARFIDRDAAFVCVPEGEVRKVAEQDQAMAFDVPGVELAREGDLSSFDAFLKKYRLEDPVLDDMAAIVRAAATGREKGAPEAPGLLAISHGLARLIADDQDLVRHGMVVCDALYASLAEWRDQPPISSADNRVAEASMESFPASDPPSFTSIAGTGRPEKS